MTSKPVDYISRIRHYYLTLGYPKPYEWATFDNTPFTLLRKPLEQCRVGLVTTAALFRPGLGDQGPGAPYNGGAKFFRVYAHPVAGDPRTSISHVGYDRKHTSAEDQATWLPLQQLKRAQQRGEIGSLSDNFYGIPTSRSQPTTIEIDAPALLAKLHADKVDIAILVANCPVCHQTCSLAARHLEQAGIPTVVMGCARDIVEWIGVPRLAFADFPLGNAAGRPHDTDSQRLSLALALDLLNTAQRANTTRRLDLDWDNDNDWKQDFYNLDRLSSEEVAKLREEFDRQKIAARLRQKSGG